MKIATFLALLMLIATFGMTTDSEALTLEEQIDVLRAKADLQFDLNTKPQSEYQTEPLHVDWDMFHRLQTAIEVRYKFLRQIEQRGLNRYLVINRSEYVLRVVDNGNLMIQERVVVGRESRKTPLITSSVQHVIFNPYWNVPHHGKTQGDIIAKLKKFPTRAERLEYIRHKKYRFFRGGQEISTDTITFTSFPGDVKIRQDPGDLNSLGRVKFLFPNNSSIYIHDTPTKNLFEKNKREFSSGCIRLQNPERLAAYLLGRPLSVVQETMSDKNPREQWLKVNPLPIFIVDGEGWDMFVTDEGEVKYHD